MSRHLYFLCSAALALLVSILSWSRTGSPYRSITFQSLHYFSRPHIGLQLTPLTSSPAAWRGIDLAMQPSIWRAELDADDVRALLVAMRHWHAVNRSIETLTVADFPLGEQLSAKIAAWREQLTERGRGFQVVRGVPLDDWTLDEAHAFFWALGLHLGITGAQDNSGELLANVRDTGADPKTERQYKTKAFIDFHCDAADVVGLLAIRTAESGGTSRLVSSVSVFNELATTAEGAQHLRRLFAPIALDTRGSGGTNFVHIPPLRFDGEHVRTFYHAEYFRSAYRHPKAGTIPDDVRAALDAYDAVTMKNELVLDMELLRGDVQLVSNHFILHSRSAYDDHPELDRRRHLLRLWLSLDGQAAFRPLKELDRLRMLIALVTAKLT
jgi:hypothetical protein